MAYVVGTTTITPHMKGDDPVKGVLKDIKYPKTWQTILGLSKYVCSVRIYFFIK